MARPPLREPFPWQHGNPSGRVGMQGEAAESDCMSYLSTNRNGVLRMQQKNHQCKLIKQSKCSKWTYTHRWGRTTSFVLKSSFIVCISKRAFVKAERWERVGCTCRGRAAGFGVGSERQTEHTQGERIRSSSLSSICRIINKQQRVSFRCYDGLLSRTSNFPLNDPMKRSYMPKQPNKTWIWCVRRIDVLLKKLLGFLCFHHLRNISKVRRMLSRSDLDKIIRTFISYWLLKFCFHLFQ